MKPHHLLLAFATGFFALTVACNASQPASSAAPPKPAAPAPHAELWGDLKPVVSVKESGTDFISGTKFNRNVLPQIVVQDLTKTTIAAMQIMRLALTATPFGSTTLRCSLKIMSAPNRTSGKAAGAGRSKPQMTATATATPNATPSQARFYTNCAMASLPTSS